MKKKEIIWREILFETIENKKQEFTQKELARKFNFSLSTVFNALKVPRRSQAIKVTGRNFKIIDTEKFLYLWATHRNFRKDIVYQTNFSGSVGEAEGLVPADAVFGAFSAYAQKYDNCPAEYDKIFIYADENKLTNIKKRFPERKGYQNVIVLKSDPFLINFGGITPDVQTFVDLWNISDWFAKDFLMSIKNKIFEK